MPPKKQQTDKDKGSASTTKAKKRGRQPLPRNSKKKRKPWDSGGSSEDEEPLVNHVEAYYTDEDSDEELDVELAAVKQKSKLSAFDGLEEEVEEEECAEISVVSSKFPVYETNRERRCVWLEDREFSKLDLPTSSEDLLIENEHVLKCLEVYEICRRFGRVVRLSPFLFEDFCAALAAINEQAPLLDEIHIALMKVLFKEDETNQTQFGAFDTRDSINISVHLLDFMTYGEVLKRYVDSDDRFGTDIQKASSNCNYPYVDVARRLVVLKFLCDQFLLTAAFKKELAGENKRNDDHCRECGKTGDLLCCDTCPAVYHLSCVEPKLAETPASGWQCTVCNLHQVPGATDCISELEKLGQSIRCSSLGFDRHGRRYWFLCRRIFVEDETSGQVWYFSTLAQFRQLLSCLDADDMERDLFEAFNQISKEILRQLELNEELTDKRKGQKRSWFSDDKRRRSAGNVQEENNKHELLKKVENLIDEAEREMKKVGSNENAVVVLEDVFGEKKLENDKTAGVYETQTPPPDLFKMGSDKVYNKYVNQYSVNQLAKNPYDRADERKWEKYMANRFSLNDEAEYNWPKDVLDSSDKNMRSIRHCMIMLLSRLSPSLMHHLWWKELLPKWKQRMSSARTPSQLAEAILAFEAAVKPVVFNDSWKHGLGHTKLYRETAEDKELRRLNDKVKQKRQQTFAEKMATCDPNDENSSIIWVKYSLLDGPPKHEIWKLKDEQYRVNGDGALGGWLWFRRPRNRTSAATWKDPRRGFFGKDENIRKFKGGAEIVGAAVVENEEVKKEVSENGFQEESGGLGDVIPLKENQGENAAAVAIKSKDGKAAEDDKKTDDNVKVLKRPPVHLFRAKSSPKPNILVLPKYVLRRFARLGGVSEQVEGFHSGCKANPIFWPYPCIRPHVFTCWRYQMSNARSLHAVALLLRIMFASIRWTDVTKSVSADAKRSRRLEDGSETRELLRHKFLPPFGLTATYFVRVLTLPNDYRESEDESEIDDNDDDYDPDNETPWKLRQRRKDRRSAVSSSAKKPSLNKPTSKMVWMREEDLVLWELRNYWSNLSTKKKMQDIALAKQQRVIETTPTSNSVASKLAILRQATTNNGKFAINVKSALIRHNANTTGQNGQPMAVRLQTNDGSGSQQVVLKSNSGMKILSLLNQKPSDSPNATASEGQNTGNGQQPPAKMLFVLRQGGGVQQIRVTQMQGSSTNTAQHPKTLTFSGGTMFVGQKPNQQQQNPPITLSVGGQQLKTQPTLNLGNPTVNRGQFQIKPDNAKQFVDDRGFRRNPQLTPVVNTSKKRSNQTRSLPRPILPRKMELNEEEEEVDFSAFHDDDDLDGIPTLKPAVRPKDSKRRSSKGVGRPRKIPPPSFDTPTAEFTPGRYSTLMDDDEFLTGIDELIYDSRRTGADHRRSRLEEREERRKEKEEMREDKRIFLECSSVLRQLVDKVCKREEFEKRVENFVQTAEQRRIYWKKYRDNRKLRKEIEDQLGSRVIRYKKEIVKRRREFETNVGNDVKKELLDGGLEFLKEAKIAKKMNKLSSLKRPAGEYSRGPYKKKPKYMNTNIPAFVNKSPSTSPKKRSLSKSAAEHDSNVQQRYESVSHQQLLSKRSDTPPDTSCICRKPYDATKFYIGCDLCSKYFHGKCVGVTAHISKRLTSWYCPDCQRERQNAKQELYCVCRTPYDESQFYISCDACDQWFHGKCVGIKAEDGEDIPAFMCQECSRNNRNGAVQPMQKPMTDDDAERVDEVVTQMRAHKMAWPFLHPVDPNRHPKYSRIVQETMDLSVVKSKMDERRYACLADFTTDVSLIFNNARKYYAPESAEFQCATVLDRYFSERLHQLKQEMIHNLSSSTVGGDEEQSP